MAASVAKHHWALVTGGNSGIGLAVAEELARMGFSVALSARDVAKLAAAEAKVTAAGAPAVESLPCDVSDPASVQALAQGLLDRHGGVGVLINNGGMMAQGSPTEGDPDEWARMMRVNVDAPMRLCRALTPGMAERGGGLVVNIGSVAAVEPMSGTSAAYAASKHALRGWSISSYLTLRHHNVKVCLVNPAFVNTPMLGNIPEEKVHRDRMIQPEDIAKYVRFCAEASAGCVPEEVTMRLGLTAWKQ